MNFSFYIAKRYLFARSRNNAINIINRIASLGIVVGTMALFVVLSVFSGLKTFSLSFSNQTDPDLKVFPKVGKSFFYDQNQISKLKSNPAIASISLVTEEKVLFLFNDLQEVTILKGVDTLFNKVNAFDKNLYNGQWLQEQTSQVVVGYGMAHKFSMGLLNFSNRLEVLVPKKGAGLIENQNDAFVQADLFPVGIYAINEELDDKYVFCDLSLAQDLLEYQPNQISAIEIKTQKNSNCDALKKDISKIFPNTTTKSRDELNDTLHKMLNTENIVVYLIFTLVIIIALFNLIGALLMMIIEKQTNLKTLLHLGARTIEIRKIFLLQGFLLSFFGGILGLILGAIVVFCQKEFQWIMITDTLPYPVEMELGNVFIVLSTIMILGFLASFVASSRVNGNFLK